LTFTAKLRNLESYLESCDVLEASYVRHKKYVLKLFSKFCKSKFQQSDEEIIFELMKQKQDERIINACDVLQLFINYLSKIIQPQTIRGYVSHVNGYFNYRGIKLSSLDLKAIRYPREIKEEKYPLSKENIRLILDNSSYRRKTLYLVLASSGMRIGETMGLRKKDFDTSGKRIRINIPAKITKGKRSRSTFVSLEVQSYLMKRLNEIEDNDLVFGTNKKESIHISEINEGRIFGKIIDKIFPNLEKYESGTRKITLHSFRAFFITQAVRTLSDSFAHAIAGQEGYLKVYKRYDKESLLEDYLKVEPALFIINDYGLSEISKDKEIESMKSDIKDLKKMFSGYVEKISKNESS